MHTPVDDLFEKLKKLPPDRLAEVEDFVDFLTRRSQHQALLTAAMAISEPTLESVWDNDQDAAYDKL